MWGSGETTTSTSRPVASFTSSSATMSSGSAIAIVSMFPILNRGTSLYCRSIRSGTSRTISGSST